MVRGKRVPPGSLRILYCFHREDYHTIVNYMYSICLDYYNKTISHPLLVVISSLSRKESPVADISRLHWTFPLGRDGPSIKAT